MIGAGARSRGRAARPVAVAHTWTPGWLPAIAVIGALGLLLVAFAYNGARQSAPWALLLFWAGIVTMITPVAVRQLMPEVGRAERAGLVIWLGLSLYLVKVLHSPLGFSLHDEFPHFRTANDILQSGHLFQLNALQNVSALFPGMQIAISAIAQLSGLSIHASAMVLIGAARLLVVLSAYLIHERVSGSPWVAGVASLLYCAYPNFVYWSAQFGYESLALPLATVTLLAIIYGAHEEPGQRWSWLLAALTLGALTVTHHLTSYVITFILVLLALVAALHRPAISLGERLFGAIFGNRLVRPLAERTAGALFPSLREPEPAGKTATERLSFGFFWLGSLGLSLAWLFSVAQQTIPYLGPHIAGAFTALIRLIAREESGRTLFRSAAPEYTLPVWERALALASVGLLTLALPVGLVFVWRRYRQHPFALLLAGFAMIYPVSLVFRITSQGAEISNRSSNYLFLAVAFVAAVAFVELMRGPGRLALRRAVAGVAIVLSLMGAIVIGMPPWARLPGPYVLMSDIRGIQQQGVSAAFWARDALEPGYRMASDKTNWLLMGSYGEQDPVETMAWIYFSPRLAELEHRDLQRRNVRYVVTDQRITTGLPISGIFFTSGEPNAGRHTEPFPAELLAKFDTAPLISRVFDSGDIQIYDAKLILELPPIVVEPVGQQADPPPARRP